jgi:hypothetical protein
MLKVLVWILPFSTLPVGSIAMYLQTKELGMALWFITFWCLVATFILAAYLDIRGK